MFNCYVHNWSHFEKVCPLCHPTHVYTSSSTAAIIGVDKKPYDDLQNQVELLQKENEELKLQVEFQKMYYNQLELAVKALDRIKSGLDEKGPRVIAEKTLAAIEAKTQSTSDPTLEKK